MFYTGDRAVSNERHVREPKNIVKAKPKIRETLQKDKLHIAGELVNYNTVPRWQR